MWFINEDSMKTPEAQQGARAGKKKGRAQGGHALPQHQSPARALRLACKRQILSASAKGTARAPQAPQHCAHLGPKNYAQKGL
jgi:hypothetical protein